MEIDEFAELEEKVKNMVKSTQLLKEENRRIKAENERMRNESSAYSAEKSEVKKKITALIQLIDSIEK